jgi:hypothetical protein
MGASLPYDERRGIVPGHVSPVTKVVVRARPGQRAAESYVALA